MNSRAGAVYVFVATFDSKHAALSFSHPYWVPEPDESVSDEAYARWEDDNPRWLLKAELGCTHLDDDFIEVLWSDNADVARHTSGYLVTRMTQADVYAMVEKAPTTANTLVLIDSKAFGDALIEPGSTETMIYCGCYSSVA